MFGLGMAEVVVILAVGLLLFGNKLPGLARSLGKALVEFKQETSALTEDVRSLNKQP